MAERRMSIIEFKEQMRARMDAFALNTRRLQQEGEEGFVGPECEYRTFEDWVAEFGAYESLKVVAAEIQRQLRYDRRGRIDRRRI